MKKIFALLLAAMTLTPGYAQRKTDQLDRGLVAVVPKDRIGIFLSWRIQDNEYFDVTYNVYKNGTKLNAKPLNVSNYFDENGTANDTYTVKAVVNGVEQAESKAAVKFASNPYTEKDYAGAPAYLSIPVPDVVDRDGNVVFCTCGNHTTTWNYSLNDACLADLDGDGEIEIIVKRINETDAAKNYPDGTEKTLYEASNTKVYTLFEAYKLDGTRLWWIDCGPNLVSLNSTELNCVAYDWDMDGKAEVLLRGADNMIIHTSDDRLINVGDMNVNTRNQINSHTDSQYAWTKDGNEYLMYLDGKTAVPLNGTLNGDNYTPMDFPIARESAGAWGTSGNNDEYGHRSSKYFFGAPFLDGRKASIFLARGIYGRTKMTAYDVDPDTHALTVVSGWPWECNTSGSKWYGQGNHNMTIADVDGDGCDEIVYGSMVIDNNGQGLSTTGLGHGDAMHVGDLDPYRKGIEVFACNEDEPSNNYRDARTSEILFRTGPHYDSKGKVIDDGRCMAGNFTNKYPGGIAASTQSGVISLTSQREISGLRNECFARPWSPMTLDYRIYWDGDLCEESMDSPGTAKDCVVIKEGNRIMQTSGVNLNNDSKNNPCAQGDILGDWREELVMRSGDNKELRIYTTTFPTEYRIPSLWYDHQYRQAMVWQVCGYNQPPHASFFLGELEGITKAPVPLTNKERKAIANNTTITDASPYNNGKFLFAPTTDGEKFTINDVSITPKELIVNVPATCVGTGAEDGAVQTPMTASIVGASNWGIKNACHLVKQGGGLLKVGSNKTLSHTGGTEVWDGSLFLDRIALNGSKLWMNRHTDLYAYHSDDLKKLKEVEMEYGSTMHISSATNNDNVARLNVGTLTLKEGARVVFNVSSDPKAQNDNLNVENLNINTQSWQYGPQYSTPVFEFIYGGGTMDKGKSFKIGTITGEINGMLDEIKIEGIQTEIDAVAYIERDGNDLYLKTRKVDYTIEEPKTIAQNAWKLDFEDPTDKDQFKIVAGAVNTKTEVEKADGSHFLHIYAGDQGGNREFNVNSVTETSNDYVFEFDFGATSGYDSKSSPISNMVITGSSSELFCLEFGNSATEAVVMKKDRTEIGRIDVTKYGGGTTNASSVPEKLYHFKITGSKTEGVYLEVTYSGSDVISKIKISEDYESIKKVSTSLGRYHSHVAFDDFKLVTYDNFMTLSDIKYPLYDESLKFSRVDIDRKMYEGYNTLCVPFSTTKNAIFKTPGNVKIYEFDSVDKDTEGNTTLHFTEIPGDNAAVNANIPYVVKVTENTPLRDQTNLTLSALQSQSVTKDGWTFKSNYVPHFNVAGNYILYNNEIRHAGPQAYVDGMRGYFIPSSGSASARIRCVFGDDIVLNGVTEIESNNAGNARTIYGIDGKRQTALSSGINIIRQANGKTIKVIK